MDYLRIFACFMVIFLHVSVQNWKEVEVTGGAWQAFNLYDSAVRSCVPLFLMLSGKLLLSRTEHFSMKKIFSRNMVKLLTLYIIWSVFYAADRIGLDQIFREDLSSIILQIIKSKYHLWYLAATISIYFLLPVFVSLVKYEKGRYLPYACLMFIIWGVGKDFLTILFPANKHLKVLFGDFSYALGDISGYFLIGYALDKYKERYSKIKTRWLLAALLIIIMTAAKIGELDAVAAGKPRDLLYGYLSLPVFLEAVILFVVFLRMPSELADKRTAAVVERLSKYTLFVYLSHVFVMDHLELWLHINSLMMNPWLSVPVLSLGLFIICMTGAWIVEKIPILGKWVM